MLCHTHKEWNLSHPIQLCYNSVVRKIPGPHYKIGQLHGVVRTLKVYIECYTSVCCALDLGT